MRQHSKFASVLFSVALALFLLSGAIAVPILWRGYYYSQIEVLSLTFRTGFSPQAIRDAFDEVMDFLVKGAPFGTGDLKWSENGMRHFADCRVLFRLDFLILAVTAVTLVVLLILVVTGRVRFYRFLGRGPCFWSFVGMAAVTAVLGGWALLDFESFFTAFHTVCFPGKTNWVFDWRTDEIILILPEEFWARTAALVAILSLGASLLLAGVEGAYTKGREPKNVYEELKHWQGRN